MDESATCPWREARNLPLDRPILALLPGSRPQEIRRMLPIFLEAARSLPDHVPVVAGAPGRSRSDYETNLPVLFGDTADLYRHAAAGLITSGTATLEAALAELPQVVAYRTSAITYALARAFSRVQFISLVNLILDREAVPERIQGQCTPEVLARTLQSILAPEGQRNQKEQYAHLRTALGSAGAADQVALSLMRPVGE